MTCDTRLSWFVIGICLFFLCEYIKGVVGWESVVLIAITLAGVFPYLYCRQPARYR